MNEIVFLFHITLLKIFLNTLRKENIYYLLLIAHAQKLAFILMMSTNKMYFHILYYIPCGIYSHTERNNWCHALERDQCVPIVTVQIVELINSSNKCKKFMRAAHNNLQRQNTVCSHKKYVILQNLLLMRLTVDTRWAKGS